MAWLFIFIPIMIGIFAIVYGVVYVISRRKVGNTAAESLNQIDSQPGQARGHSKALLIATSLFGLLYLIFIIISFIPAPEGSPVSPTVPFDPFDLEGIFVKLLFLLFLVGYLVVWKNEGIGGAIFILWWVAMWGFELLIVYPIHPNDAGFGIVVGFPLFVLGILFAVRWYKGRSVETAPPAP